MDVDLGSVPIEQARIARHSVAFAIDEGCYWKRENYDAARRWFEWIDWRIDRAEFLSMLAEDPK